ncbi:MAG: hypothetical protein QOC99_919, partial [Acidobacteriota bacterium]|nr:hypothetical protein [Acidobacteriota bacterium]
MDINKAGSLSNIGTLILTVVIIVLMVLQQLQLPQSAQA